MKNIIVTLLSIAFLMGSLFAAETNFINPEEEKQKVEEFRAAINIFQLKVKQSEMDEAKLMLNEVLILAQKNYAELEKRNLWVEKNACDGEAMDKIRYNSKGRVTKQDELIKGLKILATKTQLSNTEIETAVNYCKFYHESMKESHSEIVSIVDQCQ